jgi:hypothetical protein
VIYLTLPEFVPIAQRAAGGDIKIRDDSQLDSAAARPLASASGDHAHRDLVTSDAAGDLVIQVAAGQGDSVDIATIPESGTQPRPSRQHA